MLTESGKVIAVEDDGVWVETLQLSACSQCKARHGCGQKVLATAESRLTCIKALYGEDFVGPQPVLGQQVTIGIDEQALVRGALYSYGLPLLLMLVAVALVGIYIASEWAVMTAAAVGLVIGGLIVRASAQTSANKRCLQALLLKG